jgi:CheY-like chemotaxis protein
MSGVPRILVVDDTPQNVRLLGDLLTAKGYDVTAAASGAEALEQIERHKPDLVLLDASCRASAATTFAGASVRTRQRPRCP